MQLEATGTTHKPALRTAIVTGLMPAAATGLRGMPRVHLGHRQSAFFRFVREEREQLRKRPTMQAALRSRFALGPQPLANIGKIFEDQCATRASTRNELLRQDVVTIPAKPGLFVPEVAQVLLPQRCKRRLRRT